MMGTLDYAFFYNSQNGDRKYDAASFEAWLRKFFTTGVFAGELQVTSGDGMTVRVANGYSNINGKVKLFAESQTFDITTAHPSYNRIDNVVIERNDTLRDFQIKVVTGGATDTPTPPALVRSNAIYQICLAQVRVRAGATQITQADITDTRPDLNLCGFVAATVKEIDFGQIQAQFDSYFDQYKDQIFNEHKDFLDAIERYNNEFNAAYADFMKRSNTSYSDFTDQLNEYDADLRSRGESQLQATVDSLNTYETQARQDFNTWFAEIKATLDGDTAGKLQNQINVLKENTSSQAYLESVQDAGTTVFEGNTIRTTFANGSGELTEFNSDGSITEMFTDKDGNIYRKVKTTFEGSTIKTEVIA